jgi:hypothetical protein
VNDRRLRAFVEELELAAALLAYVCTVDDDDGEEPPKATSPSPSRCKVVALRRPSPPK